MQLALQIAEAMVLQLDRPARTPEAIGVVAEQVRVMMRATGKGVPAEQIARTLEARFEVWVPREIWVENPEGHVPWLPDREKNIEWS